MSGTPSDPSVSAIPELVARIVMARPDVMREAGAAGEAVRQIVASSLHRDEKVSLIALLGLTASDSVNPRHIRQTIWEEARELLYAVCPTCHRSWKEAL